jgi:hypothetical protein
MAQVEASLDRYFEQLDQADREESSITDVKMVNLKDKIATGYLLDSARKKGLPAS